MSVFNWRYRAISIVYYRNTHLLNRASFLKKRQWYLMQNSWYYIQSFVFISKNRKQRAKTHEKCKFLSDFMSLKS